jgi:hypothetical protein
MVERQAKLAVTKAPPLPSSPLMIPEIKLNLLAGSLGLTMKYKPMSMVDKLRARLMLYTDSSFLCFLAAYVFANKINENIVAGIIADS